MRTRSSKAWLLLPEGPSSRRFYGRVLASQGGPAAYSLVAARCLAQNDCMIAPDGTGIIDFDFGWIHHAEAKECVVFGTVTGGSLPRLQSSQCSFEPERCFTAGAAVRLAQVLFPEVHAAAAGSGATMEQMEEDFVIVEGTAWLDAKRMQWRDTPTQAPAATAPALAAASSASARGSSATAAPRSGHLHSAFSDSENDDYDTLEVIHNGVLVSVQEGRKGGLPARAGAARSSGGGSSGSSNGGSEPRDRIMREAGLVPSKLSLASITGTDHPDDSEHEEEEEEEDSKDAGPLTVAQLVTRTWLDADGCADHTHHRPDSGSAHSHHAAAAAEGGSAASGSSAGGQIAAPSSSVDTTSAEADEGGWVTTRRHR